MIKSRLAFLDPVLLARLRKNSNSIKARLRSRLQAMQTADAATSPVGNVKANGDHELVVASYNIHKCVGTDGRFEPARIAAVIAEMDADVVAIQEADRRFGRRQGLLDIEALRRETGLSLIPTSEKADGHGWHGNALLLRKGTVSDIRRLALPGAEPRGALVVDLDLPAGPLRLVAAHLGLLRRSRRWQVRSILDAIEHGPRMPILLVGDFNEWRPGRKSSLHELRPVFGPLSHSHFSFPSYFPVVALDRVIGTPGLVTAMEVHASKLAQVASDHLPLKATIDIPAAVREMRGHEDELVLSEVGA
ncbi:endonuclease/exonuclease/phosphatase family protein [Mesorhizobium sp. KR9-304]|uniref:endonuclease/exonuclease/phosphatase family protein n=1 Tax=Mesorhizobium sp. KR9-304 TaxID=3156614 RepID=UPI0032B5E187